MTAIDPRPYRLFDARVLRRERLSPALCRITFGGDDIGQIRTCAPDQRIKILFPDAHGRPPALPLDATWLDVYQAMDAAARPPRRSYTIRRLRADASELDVEFVLHGETGPASRWASSAWRGDRVQIAAPDRAYAGDPGGYEWRPPAGLENLVLMADETALPAIANILDTIAEERRRPRAHVFIEVPTDDDRLALADWPGLDLHWLPRRALGGAPGDALVAATRDVASLRPPVTAPSIALPELDVDRVTLWETAPATGGTFYAWIAAEALAVKAIRHLLIVERGWDRQAIALMGYWRRGRAMG